MQIGVSYSALAQLEENCTLTATKIKSALSSLDSELAPLAAAWTGTAQLAYQRDQKKWTTASEEMAVVLQQIGQVIAFVNGQYKNAETVNTNMFTG